MKNSFKKIIEGYQAFRDKYAHGDRSVMQLLSKYGQKPQIMVVACCDSRVDPALILQCDPGDLFVVRNVANIVPFYSKDAEYQGTSAALEFGVRCLNVEHIILLGHSQCGGIDALLNGSELQSNDFIDNWVSLIKTETMNQFASDDYAEYALKKSYKNCMTFPWISERVKSQDLVIHLWFFDIKTGQIFTYCNERKGYQPLDVESSE